MGNVFGGDAPSIVAIKVFGIGGGGCNAINRLVNAGITGVDFIAANTDMMALDASKVGKRIQLGEKLTQGLGAGAKPDIGEQAALESKELIIEAIDGANLVFITAGMGGGTGTGGAPVVASIAKELGILTIAVVTKPFEYEGKKKMQMAELGIEKLKKEVDVLVVIPNEKAFEYVPKTTPFLKVVQIADDVLHNSIIGITDIVVRPSLIHLDFADIVTVIKNMGTAHIGIGRAKGENRVVNALRQAASSPLLESNIEGATRLIVNVTGDKNLNGQEVREALGLITNVVAPDANIISGLGFDDTLKEEVIVTVIATGFDATANVLVNETQKEFTMPVIDIFASKNKEEPKQEAAPTPAPEPARDINEDDIPAFLQNLRNRGRR